MGNGSSRISDRERIRIYKRVPLALLRRSRVVSPEAIDVWDVPQSRNFTVAYPPHPNGTVPRYTLTLSHHELAGHCGHHAKELTLNHLLRCVLHPEPDDTFVVGLTEKHYRAFEFD